MATAIVIEVGGLALRAELNDAPTARALAAALPLTARGQRWGGELYFATPVAAELEPDARDVLAAGELGYWPTGQAFCIFWGATPASGGGEIRAASAVNVVGRLQDDCKPLEQVANGAPVCVRRADAEEGV